MPEKALFITQCLQRDFVQPIGRTDPLPNLLHVGAEESTRLMGENPDEGPVARVMHWAAREPPEKLGLIHIRDWHDADDPSQRSHLAQFGPHCLRGTPGADFAFEAQTGRAMAVVDSLTLNDFQGTNLAEVLAPFADEPVRVGLAGVWTEAKIFFLAYELRTRYPNWSIGVCSALTASASRSQHFIALDQLRKLLGVEVIDSVGAFIEYLGGSAGEKPLIGSASWGALAVEGGEGLDEIDSKLLRYLFRDSRRLRVRGISGGYSGSRVYGCESEDAYGQAQAPHVVKIGPRDMTGKERTAFERIESVLGNSAPRVADFADIGPRGAIKYRYASMTGGGTTFQKICMGRASLARIRRILREVFVEHLGKFTRAATRERVNLLEHHGFRPGAGARLRARAAELLGPGASEETLRFPGGRVVRHPALFYEREVAAMPAERTWTVPVSYVHGDLNGANILVDDHENVWLIDFFHTARRHAIQDLVKLENDLLYIFTPVEDDASFAAALDLSDILMEMEDPPAPPSPARNFAWETRPLRRAYEIIATLRSFLADIPGEDLDPAPIRIARLRYAAHTVSFGEPNLRQRRWALYAAARYAEKISEEMTR